MSHIPTVLSIAASDSCGGAGIQADIKTSSFMHVHAATVLTAVTAQSTGGIRCLTPLPPDFVEAQFESILEDITPDAIKIGMLGSVANGIKVAEIIKNRLPHVPSIVDPVLSATMGGDSCGNIDELIVIYRNFIFPGSTVVTPNLNEAAIFCNISSDELRLLASFNPYKLGKIMLDEIKSTSVILKGGHLSGEIVSDFLCRRRGDSVTEVDVFSDTRTSCVNLHGTGCTFSTLLASEMALGKSIHDAFFNSSKIMKEIIRTSCGYEYGTHKNGILNLSSFRIIK